MIWRDFFGTFDEIWERFFSREIGGIFFKAYYVIDIGKETEQRFVFRQKFNTGSGTCSLNFDEKSGLQKQNVA